MPSAADNKIDGHGERKVPNVKCIFDVANEQLLRQLQRGPTDSVRVRALCSRSSLCIFPSMPLVPSTYSVQSIFVLVPTVALAAQWNDVISAQLPSVQVRFLSGSDGVDRWQDQWIWDEVLSNVRVVVCTYQVRISRNIASHAFRR